MSHINHPGKVRVICIVIHDIIMYGFLGKGGDLGNHWDLALKIQIKKEKKNAIQFI